MGFLALAVACSLGIAALFTLAERRNLDRTALLAANYAAAAVLALALGGASFRLSTAPAAVLPLGADAGPLPASGTISLDIVGGLLGLGVVQGLLFIAGYWLFARAIREAGIGLAAAAMRLSVVLSVLAAWAVWAEAPTGAQGVGLVLGGAAFVLLARPARAAETPTAEMPAAETSTGGRGAAALLGALFVVGGAVDVGMKAFRELYAVRGVPPATFLLVVFTVAFAVGALLVVTAGIRTGRWPRPSVLLWGTGLGVLNYFSAEFLLRALDVLPAPVAFPLNNVSVVLGAALVGRVAFGERMSRVNAAGLAVAALAVALLAG